MSEPTFCGIHAYMGFETCPQCLAAIRAGAITPDKLAPAKPPVVLNGERIRFEIRTKSKPWWIPGFAWNGLCRMVIRNTNIIAVSQERRP